MPPEQHFYPSSLAFGELCHDGGVWWSGGDDQDHIERHSLSPPLWPLVSCAIVVFGGHVVIMITLKGTVCRLLYGLW